MSLIIQLLEQLDVVVEIYILYMVISLTLLKVCSFFISIIDTMVEEIVEKVICFLSGDEIPKSEAVELKDGVFIHQSRRNDVFQCDSCDEWFDIDDCTTTHNDSTICSSCRTNYYKFCEDCDEWYHEDDMIDVNGDWVCQDCVHHSGNYFQCYDCDDWFHNDDCHEHRGEYYCNRCYDNIDLDDDGDYDSESKD